MVLFVVISLALGLGFGWNLQSFALQNILDF